MTDIFKPKFNKIVMNGFNISNLEGTTGTLKSTSQEYYSKPEVDCWLQKVQELIATWPKVYAYTGPASRKGGMWIVEGSQDADSDHQAHLAFIEEIPKAECEHEGYLAMWSGNIGSPINQKSIEKYECRKCGKPLKANWEIAE